MRYAPPAIRPSCAGVRETGPAREVEENGLPLGLMDVAAYTEVEQRLRRATAFVLYTDGLVDATDAAGEFFTLERVKATIAESARRLRGRRADLIVEKARAWAKDVAADDLTLVLVDCV